MGKVAVVTGGSSGIGLCTARSLKEKGCTVYELSRHDGTGEFLHITADVTDEAQVASAIAQVMEKEGRIDLVVNCAGFGISGATEFTETEDAKQQMEVNFFGMVHMNKAVLPIMREHEGGRIVNISSVAAPIPIPFQTYYSASKAAISSYTCALANEVAPFGISVCAILPGDTSTGFTKARKKSVEGDDVYGGRISRSVKVMEHDEMNGTDPRITGDYIAKIAFKKNVKPYYAVGFKNKLFCLIMKLLPIGLSNKLVGMIYAK